MGIDKTKPDPSVKRFVDTIREKFTMEEIAIWSVDQEIEKYRLARSQGTEYECSKEEQDTLSLEILTVPLEEVPMYIGKPYPLIRSLANWRLEIGK